VAFAAIAENGCHRPLATKTVAIKQLSWGSVEETNWLLVSELSDSICRISKENFPFWNLKFRFRSMILSREGDYKHDSFI
jgi:hypothetical protein